MKTLFGMAAIVAVAAMSLAAIDSAEARGPRGARQRLDGQHPGRAARDRAGHQARRVPRSCPPRQINGPREGGRGINCGPSGRTQQTIINPRTGRSETVTIATGPIRCSTRY